MAHRYQRFSPEAIDQVWVRLHPASMGGEHKPGGEGGDQSPYVSRMQGPEGPPDPLSPRTIALEVDGEQFAVRLVVDPATGYTATRYTWLTSPHNGYGFGDGGRRIPSLEDHQQSIRNFLAMIDPTTGYIED